MKDIELQTVHLETVIQIGVHICTLVADFSAFQNKCCSLGLVMWSATSDDTTASWLIIVACFVYSFSELPAVWGLSDSAVLILFNGYISSAEYYVWVFIVMEQEDILPRKLQKLLNMPYLGHYAVGIIVIAAFLSIILILYLTYESHRSCHLINKY
jgi:hypothetical protein